MNKPVALRSGPMPAKNSMRAAARVGALLWPILRMVNPRRKMNTPLARYRTDMTTE
jgi:hypothetical protein